MPLDAPVRIVNELASRGYNADRGAVTLLANADDPRAAIDAAVETAPSDTPVLTADHVKTALADDSPADAGERPETTSEGTATDPTGANPSISTGTQGTNPPEGEASAAVETKGSASRSAPDKRSLEVTGDVTGRSTGTGVYEDFVAVFRDRYERLAAKLQGRVTHRPTSAIQSMAGGADAAMIGMIDEFRSTPGGHWLVELEDPTGTFPCMILKGREVAGVVDELLTDEVVGIQGTLADDGEVLFADELHFPDVPRTHRPETADRHVKAALVSDVHVGSQEFLDGTWTAFADWLHSSAADAVEYLLIAGDMVEGVGVYPDQDEELDIIDIYEQYERFSEHLKEVPGDLDIVMIPGNHDAVRLAEPQPAFDEELRDIMTCHDARVVGNPSVVTLEGVSVLMYHGVSLDEIIAELPATKASYEEPHTAMYQLLKKRHVAPKYGGHTRLAPEDRDYLVIDDVPDIFHAGHTHTLGVGEYHNVLVVNSGCWQDQTSFQRSVNIDPDVGFAPIVSLDTLDIEVMSF